MLIGITRQIGAPFQKRFPIDLGQPFPSRRPSRPGFTGALRLAYLGLHHHLHHVHTLSIRVANSAWRLMLKTFAWEK